LNSEKRKRRGVARVYREQEYEQRGGQQQAGTNLPEPGWESEASESYQVYPGITLLDERDRQRQQLWRELQELDRRIAASDGYSLYNRMNLLKKSYFVFDTNYLALKQALTEFEQPMVFSKLWEQKNRSRLDMFTNDVVRLFFNYVAGAEALLKHIHVVHEDVNHGTSFSEEYRTRQEQQLRSAPLPSFVEDLLEYMLYKELPFALAELNFGESRGSVEVNSAIKLDVDKLSEWERWSEKVREYLDALDHKVRLYDIVSEHKAMVADFYQWFVTRQSDIHREALAELEELEGERTHLQQKMMHLEDLLEAAERTTISVREEQETLAKELETERELLEREKERADELEAALKNTRRRWWRRG
jgi:hypothetical protein